ncbi:MAG: aspartate aminotransferase family protein [Gammaproteobacteria bacterium]|nr:aspartate aminotransferase family protein [Gammaproteobacteria bacterium]
MNQVKRNTADWQQLDREHHIHPFSDPAKLNAKGARIITRAEGSYIWDSEGNKILDGMAGLWCVNVGYGRRELIEAATSQMQELPYNNTFFQTASPPQVELGQLLSEVTPEGLDHFFYSCSGSEANDTVVRLVRHYWEVMGQPSRKAIISRHNAYHGSTLVGTSLGGMEDMHKMGGSLLPDFHHINQPHWYLEGENLTEEEFGLARALELEAKIEELGPENVAAFIGEPIQGAGGVIVAPANYWGEIQRICKKYDILLIADEVICGFGRTGNWFGSQTLGIKPDVMTMAKGLSSGYLPISGVALHDRVADVLISGGEINHGYTYSSHPVASAVAIANINYIRDHGLVEKVREETGPYLQEGFRKIADRHPLLGEVRGHGLICGIQMVKSKDPKTLFTKDDDVGTHCRNYCFENNLVMRGVGNSMVLSPPLTISLEEIDELLEKAEHCFNLTAKDYGVL